MNTLGERLKYARKSKGYTQDTLANTIGVSRGVIFNIEKNKTKPQSIVINAICQTLSVSKEWLLTAEGEPENYKKTIRSAKILTELFSAVKELSEEEQLYLLDIIKALKKRLTVNPLNRDDEQQ